MSCRHFQPAWYALQVKSNHEQTVSQVLKLKGYEVFLPLRKLRHKWSDRVKVLMAPLFPGYLFCRYDWRVGPHLVTTSGIIRVVGFGSHPAPLEDTEIEMLQTVVQSGVNLEPCQYRPPMPAVGDRVIVHRGPLTGVEGTVSRIKNCHRLIISIPLIQRSIAAELDAYWIAPISSQTAQAGGSSVPTN